MAKILVAEDDKFLSKAYAAKLKKSGFEVALAVDGEEAISKARTDKPDVVLLDLVMPKKDGFDALYDLKQDKITQSIPIIVLSNLGQEEDIKRAKELGAEDYLVKSNIAIQDVVDKIKQVLSKHK